MDNPVDKALREGVIVGLANHTVLISRDGVERPIDDSAAPIRNPQGEIIGVVLVFRDVTGRRESEEQLRRLNQRLKTNQSGPAAVLLRRVSRSERAAANRHPTICNSSAAVIRERCWMRRLDNSSM